MAGVLQELSNAMADMVEGVGPSVVRVEGRRRLGATGIVWSADGGIVTAHHTLEANEGVQVGLADGTVLPAQVAGRDPATDLAMLKVEANGLALPQWAETQAVKVGHLVLALGRPGKTARASMGIVGAYGGAWRTPLGGHLERYLQTDVTMFPGFSGGPLVAADGRLIGLNTSALLRGVSVTVPADSVRRIAESLLTRGHVSRGYLGIGAQPVRLPSSHAEQTSQETGVLVTAVVEGCPAEQAGLLLGDIVVTYGKTPVRHMDDLLAALSAAQVGETVTMDVIRGGEQREVVVRVGEQPQG